MEFRKLDDNTIETYEIIPPQTETERVISKYTPESLMAEINNIQKQIDAYTSSRDFLKVIYDKCVELDVKPRIEIDASPVTPAEVAP